MNAQEVLELVRAGFSRQEILNLVGTPAGDPPAPAANDPLPDPAPAGDPAPGPDPEPAEPTAGDPTESRFKAIESALKEVTAALQAAAIRQTEQPNTTITLEDAMNAIAKEYN